MDTLTALRRRRLHLQAANAIEKLRPEDFEDLAFHYEEAGDDQRALTYHRKAAERAAAAYANQEAEGHFLTALELVDSPEQRAQLLAGLADVQQIQFKTEEAERSRREAISIFQSLGDLDMVARMYGLLTWAAWETGSRSEAYKIAREGMSAVGDQYESPGYAFLLHEVARASYFSNQIDEMEANTIKALTMAERLGDVEVQSEALITLSLVPSMPIDEKIRNLEQAVRLAEENGLLFQAARAHNNLASHLVIEGGNTQQAFHHCLQAVDIAAKQGDIFLEKFYANTAVWVANWMGNFAWSEEKLKWLQKKLEESGEQGANRYRFIYNTGNLRRGRGQLSEASELFKIATEQAEQENHQPQVNSGNHSLADVMVEQGHLEEAREVLEKVIRNTQLEDYSGIMAGSLLSLILVRMGHRQEALRTLAMARARLHELDIPFRETNFLARAEAHVALSEQNWPVAWQAFDKAVSGFRQMGACWEQARTLQMWAEAHITRGQPEDKEAAERLFKEAAGLYEEIGVDHYLQEVRQKLAAL